MERATYETAGILRDLYNEEFGGDEFEPYQIGWDQLRGIAGVERLTDSILSDIGTAMLDSGYALVPLYELKDDAYADYSYMYSCGFDYRFLPHLLH